MHEPPPAGLVFDIQRYSIHDGPGIRTTVFLKGCSLRCTWCHNPEGLSPRPEIRVIEARCDRCGACAPVCPLGLTVGEGAWQLPDGERCLRCGRCADACPTGARTLVGRSVAVDELTATIARDRPFYDESGGGVTFSGGEPLTQAAFLRASLLAAREAAIHTAVDTSGFAARRTVLALAPVTDLFLYDLKTLNPARHRQLTGVPLEPIVANLRALDRAGADVWIRAPLVAGLNDGDADIAALGRLVAGLRHTRRVHLLPYHGLGADKYERLGRAPQRPDLVAPSAEAMARSAARLSGFGLDVHIGG
ncbi:MAG: glycyl-radical enzyme activating protein [Chloroflexota bacterium]